MNLQVLKNASRIAKLRIFCFEFFITLSITIAGASCFSVGPLLAALVFHVHKFVIDFCIFATLQCGLFIVGYNIHMFVKSIREKFKIVNSLIVPFKNALDMVEREHNHQETTVEIN